MPTVSFLTNLDTGSVNNLSGSGLGFFGSAFNTSVEVGAYQDTTWITDGNGINQGPQVNNVKYTHASSGSLNGAASVSLLNVPNYLSTLNIRFTHTSAIKTQNSKVYIYDRTSINNGPSGVTCKCAEIIHPSTSQLVSGSGDSTWATIAGSGSILTLVDNPGPSGFTPADPISATQHDWYVAISASPDSIGSKTLFGLYFSTEYL